MIAIGGGGGGGGNDGERVRMVSRLRSGELARVNPAMGRRQVPQVRLITGPGSITN